MQASTVVISNGDDLL